MLNELKKGDKVVTIGGIYGTVFAADDRTVVLKVDDNTRIKFQKAAISSLIIDAPKNEQPQKKGLLAGLFGKKGAEKTEEKKPEANTDASAEEKASENSEKSEEK